MNKSQLIEFHKRYADSMKVRFVEAKHWGVVAKFARYFLDKYISKYSGSIEEIISEEFRPHVIGKNVVLTYNIGDVSSVSWLTQIAVAVHEVEHVVQQRVYCKKGGKVAGWYRDYFLKGAFRATQEGGAIASGREANFAITGLNSNEASEISLENYYVTEVEKKIAQTVYNKRIERVNAMGRGFATSKASAVAIGILEDMGILSYGS